MLFICVILFSEKVSLDKTPPIYSIVNKNRQRASSSFDNLESGPKSPPIPPRPDRNYSETSSEGPDDNQNKTGGLVTHSLSDSPFKPKRIPKAFKQSKKLTEEEVTVYYVCLFRVVINALSILC